MIGTSTQLGEDSAMIVLSFGSDDCLVRVRSLFLVQNELKLEVAMDWCNHSHNRGFLKSEGDLVCLVVP